MSRSSTGGAAESDSPSWSADPLIGKVIDGRYRIEDVLGTGGVGVVYRAEHLKLQRRVAIKVLHDKLGLIDELRRRFEREGQALSALSHPNVVSVNDYGISDGMPYLVMELLNGRTLADLIDDDGPPDIETAMQIQRQILRGLAFAHEKGIVHRDLKAANVFLQELPDAPHHVKILDFGLAKIFTTEQGDADPTLTKSGTILGTPAYMSPEQATGSNVDERADVYSAGVLFYEILTGRYPFEAPTRAEMLRAHLLEPVPDPEAGRAGLSLTPELRAFLDKAMQKERQDRWSSAGEMLDALDALPSPPASFDPHAGSGEIVREQAPIRSDAPTMTVGQTDAGTKRSFDVNRVIRLGAIGLGVLLLALAVALVIWPSEPAPEAGAESVSSDFEATGSSPQSSENGENPDLVPDDVEPVEDLVDDPDELVTTDDEGVAETAAVDAGLGGLGTLRDAWPEARDPFRRGVPRSLVRYHRKVQRGRRLSTRERRSLFQIQRAVPDDPRPTLVLAHHFMDIVYFSDALERYRQAVTIDPSARGDRRMLPDLIRMAQSPAVATRAADLIVQVYGPEAVDAVERAMRREQDPVRVGMLTSLRSRLPSSGE
jgi:serine/threonine-protein kinase